MLYSNSFETGIYCSRKIHQSEKPLKTQNFVTKDKKHTGQIMVLFEN